MARSGYPALWSPKRRRLGRARSREPILMGDVLLTGATGFVGRELLARFLERDEGRVHALVRARDDDEAAARLPEHERLSAWAGDIERPALALDARLADELAERVSTVVHCAASVSFSLR